MHTWRESAEEGRTLHTTSANARSVRLKSVARLHLATLVSSRCARNASRGPMHDARLCSK